MGKPQRTAPATRAPSNPYRNKLIGKAKLACKQLGIEDDDYRAMLLAETGKDSLTKCTDAQIVAVIEHLKRKGFRAAKGNRGEADHPVARKARAMWHSLYLLGEVRNPNEKALEAFACKQLKCPRFAWARQSQGGKVIEALKDMAVRNGWVQVTPGGKPLDTFGLQESLCRALVQKVQDKDGIPADWTFGAVVHALRDGGAALDVPLTADDFKKVAASLGSILRNLQGAAA